MIFDTDILIWFHRGADEAERAIEITPPDERFISIITYLELVQGVNSKAELKKLKETIQGAGFTILPINEAISLDAAKYLESYRLKSGLDINDAFIAATASYHGRTLFTGNFKHFKDLNISIRQFAKN
jgi:predicted nucleic acid-binding protein